MVVCVGVCGVCMCVCVFFLLFLMGEGGEVKDFQVLFTHKTALKGSGYEQYLVAMTENQ